MIEICLHPFSRDEYHFAQFHFAPTGSCQPFEEGAFAEQIVPIRIAFAPARLNSAVPGEPSRTFRPHCDSQDRTEAALRG
jgi:hypothetical protein